MTADVQRELAEVLASLRTADGTAPLSAKISTDEIADALLPVVERAERRAAAGALREAADACAAHGNTWRQTLARNSAPFGYARWLRDRAAALDPSGAAEGAGR